MPYRTIEGIHLLVGWFLYNRSFRLRIGLCQARLGNGSYSRQSIGGGEFVACPYSSNDFDALHPFTFTQNSAMVHSCFLTEPYSYQTNHYQSGLIYHQHWSTSDCSIVGRWVRHRRTCFRWARISHNFIANSPY